MAFALKELDDRSFQSLVDEAKRRIVSYLPEWTDHNESDPGITLVQLFAWLTETAIFRLNQVPNERMYLSFLNVLGLSPASSKSAQAIIALDVRPGASPALFQPSELRFSASGESGEVGFEADSATPIIGASLAIVLVDDKVGSTRLDVTAQNETGTESYSPFGVTSIAQRALYLGLDTVPAGGGAPGPLIQPGSPASLQLYVRADEAKVPLVPASTSFGETLASLESDLVWEASGPKNSWLPLQVELDQSRGMTRSGLVRLKLTGEVSPTSLQDDPKHRQLYWIRASAQSSSTPETRSVRYIAINAVRVRQWTTFLNELLVPGSDGTPTQIRKVRNGPILVGDDTLRVEVNEPDPNGNLVWITWTQTDNLGSREIDGVAQPGDRPLRVFQVLPDRSGIEFGDGLEGLIPPRGVNNLRISYRSGGGVQGNVAAGKIELAVSQADIAGSRQIEAASGGVEAEATDQAVKDAPGRIRAVERAVTARDFEVLAKEQAGVARASALNRYHPLYPDVPVTGAVTLVVVPQPVGQEPAPMPLQPVLDEVAQVLEPYRVLTTELFVVAPRYRDVAVKVELEVRRELDAPEARASVTKAIAAFFDPIRGGPDGEGWPLGGTIAYGELLSTVLGADKVSAVRSLTIVLDGKPQPTCADVVLAPEGTRSIDLIRAAAPTLSVAAPAARR